MPLRFKHDEILSSKNSLYSNLMETGITILCKTGKNKIKKNSFLFNIKQYNHNTRIWSSTVYFLWAMQVSISLDCAIHNVVKSKNRKPKWWELKTCTFTTWHTSKGIDSRAKRLNSPHLPMPSFQPEKPSGCGAPFSRGQAQEPRRLDVLL